jgi:hypothetical protein
MRTSDGQATTNRAAATTSFRAVRRKREPGLSVIDAQSLCDIHRTALETERMVAVTRHDIEPGFRVLSKLDASAYVAFRRLDISE